MYATLEMISNFCIVLCIDPFIKLERRVTYSMIESLIMTQFELRARLTQLNFSILITITYASCEMCLEL